MATGEFTEDHDLPHWVVAHADRSVYAHTHGTYMNTIRFYCLCPHYASENFWYLQLPSRNKYNVGQLHVKSLTHYT